MAMKSHAKLNYFMDFMLSGHGWHSPVSPELSKQRARDYVVRATSSFIVNLSLLRGT